MTTDETSRVNELTTEGAHLPATKPSHVVFLRLALLLAALFALVMAWLPQPPQLPGQPSDMLQHIIAFVVLTLLSRAAYPAVRPAIIFAGLAAFGALIEIVQSIPSLHRDASVVDWIVDCLAVAVTLGVAVVAKRMIETATASSPRV